MSTSESTVNNGVNVEALLGAREALSDADVADAARLLVDEIREGFSKVARRL